MVVIEEVLPRCTWHFAIVPFLTKTLGRVSAEMSLHVLAYKMKRVINLVGTKAVLEAI